MSPSDFARTLHHPESGTLTLDQMFALTSDNADQQQRLRSLRMNVEALMAKLRRNVEFIRQGQKDQAERG